VTVSHTGISHHIALGTHNSCNLNAGCSPGGQLENSEFGEVASILTAVRDRLGSGETQEKQDTTSARACLQALLAQLVPQAAAQQIV
jgi:hypothetical protein